MEWFEAGQRGQTWEGHSSQTGSRLGLDDEQIAPVRPYGS